MDIAIDRTNHVMSEINKATIRNWLPHIVWLVGCSVVFGSLIQELKQLRKEFDHHTEWADARSKQLDDQRMEVRVSMERLSVLLEQNSKAIEENNRRLETANEYLRKRAP